MVMSATAATVSGRIVRGRAALRQFGTGLRVSFDMVGIIAQKPDALAQFVHIRTPRLISDGDLRSLHIV